MTPRQRSPVVPQSKHRPKKEQFELDACPRADPRDLAHACRAACRGAEQNPAGYVLLERRF